MPPIRPYFEGDVRADFLQGGYEETPLKPQPGAPHSNVAHLTGSFVQSPFGSRNPNLIFVNKPDPGPVCPVFFFLDWKEYDETNGYHEPIGGPELFGRTREPIQHPYYRYPDLYFSDFAILRSILELSNGREGGVHVDWRFPASGAFHPRANPNWKFILVLPHGEMRHHEPVGTPAEGEDSWFVEATDFGRIVPHGFSVPCPVHYLGPSLDQTTWNGSIPRDPIPDGLVSTHLDIVVGSTVLRRDPHATTLPVFSADDFFALVDRACPEGVQALGYFDTPSHPERWVFVGAYGYVDTEQFFDGLLVPVTRQNDWIGQGRSYSVTRDIFVGQGYTPGGDIARRLFGQIQSRSLSERGYRTDLWQVVADDAAMLVDGEYAGVDNRGNGSLYLRYFGDVVFRYLKDWFAWLVGDPYEWPPGP